jgi:RimJ/RimL family protein N-acetyltransferase/acyl carrier protein
MLNKELFFTRLTSICPGSAVPGIDNSSIEFDIYFEPLSIAGLEEMHRYSQDARLYEFFEFDRFDTIEKTKSYIEKLEQRMAGDILNRTAMYWFVRRKADKYLIGTAALVSANHDRQSVEWGYGVDPDLWGEGYIFQIEGMLKQYVFEVLELNRLYGTSMVTNQRTIASLLASGMKHEGTLRQFYSKNGVFIDAWQYAMLREEYLMSERNLACTVNHVSTQEVINIIKSVLTEEEITPTSTMRTALSWDSLNHMSIMIAVAEKTGISLSPSEIMRANSVQTLTSILVARTVEE